MLPDETTRQRLFGIGDALDHPVVLGIVVAVVAALIISPVIVLLLAKLGKITPEHRRELLLRIGSWAVLAPLMIGPILLGAFWTILGVCVLSLLCYREYARVTGLFREKLVSFVIVIGIVLLTFATLDHWHGLFMALGPLVVAVLAAAGLAKDQPKGYVQRVALGVFGWAMFGIGLGHLGYFANDTDYRPILAMLLLAVELNDVFAYCSGKLLGRRKLAPQTSPNKTIGGSLGALVLTTALVALLCPLVFRGSALAHPLHGIAIGLLISVGGQLGDLVLSSIKRDVGIKDMGNLIPGHGGLLDRFDSLLLVAPAVFHYVEYFRGVGLGQLSQWITAGQPEL